MGIGGLLGGVKSDLAEFCFRLLCANPPVHDGTGDRLGERVFGKIDSADTGATLDEVASADPSALSIDPLFGRNTSALRAKSDLTVVGLAHIPSR
jgi:hypothetical protein